MTEPILPLPAGMRFYVLGDDGRTPVRCGDALELARAMGGDCPVVAQDMVGETTVSTAFLFLDHQWIPGGPPQLFETMVCRGDRRRVIRYSTWEEAEAGHAETCELLETRKLQL